MKIAKKDIVRFLGWAGIVGAAFFVLVFVLLHVLRSDLNPVAQYISQYGNGRFSTLFQFSLVIHGLGNVCIGAGLMISLYGSGVGRLGAALFALASVGAILGGIFPIDPPLAAPTTIGTIHRSVAFASMPIEAGAVILLSLAFGGGLQWRSFLNVTLTVSAMGITFLALSTMAVLMQTFEGLAERAVFITYLFWEIRAAMRLATLQQIGKAW